MSQEPPGPTPSRAPLNRWKIVAIVALLLMGAAVGSKVLLHWGHRSPFLTAPVTEEQKGAATTTATAALGPRLQALGNYTTTVAPRGISMETAEGPRSAIPVTFTAGNTTLTALVDLSTREVVQTVEVHSAGWMSEMSLRRLKEPREEFSPRR